MHISEKLYAAQKTGKPGFSFEFFPPKTAQGVQNLYDRMYDLPSSMSNELTYDRY